MTDIAIKIENLKKQYKLGEIGGTTLTAELQNWWARKRGKENPNVQIGVNQSKLGETFYALNGIDLEVKKGEALGIIGSNGAGKSTLLKILSRVTSPTEGAFGVNGRIASMLEVGTGFSPYLTGRENIYMNGAILGMTKKEVDEKIEDIIEFSECRQFIDTPVKRYSSGMYVKLAFAVAAHLDAEIMIMDEVLAVGDVKFQEKCLGTMGKVSGNQGKTILYVSHNMATIRHLCKRCVVLDHGRIVFDGETEKAIGMYIGLEEGKEICKYNFKMALRPSENISKKIFLENLEFVEKDNAIFNEGDVVKLCVRFRGIEDVKSIRFYLPIKAIDGSNVALVESDSICDISKNEIKQIYFSFSLGDVVAGKYYFYFGAYVLGCGRASERIDMPMTKIYFTVMESVTDRLIFKSQYWGFFRLNNIVIDKQEVIYE